MFGEVALQIEESVCVCARARAHACVHSLLMTKCPNMS